MPPLVDALHFRWQDCLGEGSALDRARATCRRPAQRDGRPPVRRLGADGHGRAGAVARSHCRRPLALAEQAPRAVVARLGELRRARCCRSTKAIGERAREMSEVGLAAQPRGSPPAALRALLEYQLGDFEAGAAYAARLQRGSREGAGAGSDRRARLRLPPSIPLLGRHRRHRRAPRRGVALAAAERLLALPTARSRSRPRLPRTGLALVAVQRERCRRRRRSCTAPSSRSGAPRASSSPSDPRPSAGPARRHLRAGRDRCRAFRGRARVLRSCRLPPRARLDGVRLRRDAARAEWPRAIGRRPSPCRTRRSPSRASSRCARSWSACSHSGRS